MASEPVRHGDLVKCGLFSFELVITYYSSFEAVSAGYSLFSEPIKKSNRLKTKQKYNEIIRRGIEGKRRSKNGAPIIW